MSINGKKLKEYAQKKYGEAKEAYKESREKQKEIASAASETKHKIQIEEAKKFAAAKVRHQYTQKTKRMKSGGIGFGGMSIGLRAPPAGGDPFGLGFGASAKPAKKAAKKRKRRKKKGTKKGTKKNKGRTITINV